MAVDTKSLTDIITEGRAIQSKDTVSSENLGNILKRIANVQLASVGISKTIAIIDLLDGFKAARQAIIGPSQGQADRQYSLYVNKTTPTLTEAVQARYEYLLRIRILDFYAR